MHNFPFFFFFNQADIIIKIMIITINSLTTNDAYMRHVPCELPISLWELIWSIKYKALYFSTGILLILAVSYGG